MRRRTVRLPDDLDARMRREAARRDVTLSELIREAIETFLDIPKRRRYLHAPGAGASGQPDVAERIEEILAGDGRP